MMLEEHVVLVGSATNATENVALHELINIRTKTVDNLYGALAWGSMPGYRGWYKHHGHPRY